MLVDPHASLPLRHDRPGSRDSDARSPLNEAQTRQRPPRLLTGDGRCQGGEEPPPRPRRTRYDAGSLTRCVTLSGGLNRCRQSGFRRPGGPTLVPASSGSRHERPRSRALRASGAAARVTQTPPGTWPGPADLGDDVGQPLARRQVHRRRLADLTDRFSFTANDRTSSSATIDVASTVSTASSTSPSGISHRTRSMVRISTGWIAPTARPPLRSRNGAGHREGHQAATSAGGAVQRRGRRVHTPTLRGLHPWRLVQRPHYSKIPKKANPLPIATTPGSARGIISCRGSFTGDQSPPRRPSRALDFWTICSLRLSGQQTGATDTSMPICARGALSAGGVLARRLPRCAVTAAGLRVARRQALFDLRNPLGVDFAAACVQKDAMPALLLVRGPFGWSG